MVEVRETSLETFEQIKERLEPNEQRVFEILLELGPTHDKRILEALNQKEKQKSKVQRTLWEMHTVTPRRRWLVLKGVVDDLGPHRGLWCGKKKTYHIWRVKHDDRQPVGWVPVPSKPKTLVCKEPVEFKSTLFV